MLNVKLSVVFALLFVILTPLKGSFRECVDRQGRWDFKKEECYPGRIWQNETPTEIIQQIKRKLTEEEYKTVRNQMGLDLEGRCGYSNPLAIILIGPAGAGKSTLLKNKKITFYDVNKYVLFDGDIVRNANQDYKNLIIQSQYGYINSSSYIKPFVYQIKDNLMAEMIDRKCNIVASMVIGDRDRKYIEQLMAANYNIQYVFIYVDYDEARYRGLNRAQETGRPYKHSKKKWANQIEFINEIANTCQKYQIIDNTSFYNPQEIDLLHLSCTKSSLL